MCDMCKNINIYYMNVGLFCISNCCLHTYPCKHIVRNNKTGEITTMNGVEIYNMLYEHNITVKHFESYCNLKKKQANIIKQYMLT
jgi:hypothetical protein